MCEEERVRRCKNCRYLRLPNQYAGGGNCAIHDFKPVGISMKACSEFEYVDRAKLEAQKQRCHKNERCKYGEDCPHRWQPLADWFPCFDNKKEW